MNDGDYQKLKIGYLTERMILGFGVDLVVHETARRFAESGHDVTVFTTKKSDLYVDESYKIVDLTETVVVNQDIFSPHFMVECINQLSHCDIDVWIAQTPPFYSWLTFLRPPVILVEHGTPPGKFFKGKMARDLDTMTAHRYNVIYSTLRPGDTVVAISEFIRSGLPENVSRNAITILNGGDHYPRTTENAKVTFRKTIGLSENDIMLLWVGRIDPFVDYQPYKGLQEFLEVSPIIRKKYPHCKIVAVGRAEERARKPLEDAGIIPVFNLGKDTMPSAYAAADIFINTSRWEGFNLPLIEAQFQGTPVIAYNIGAHREVVDNGRSGILVSDPSDWLESLSKLIEDNSLRKSFATHSLKHADGFTWNRNASCLMSVTQKALKEACASGKRQPKAARIRKLPPYYIWKAREIIRKYGWIVLVKESMGWIRRRIIR